MSSPRLYKVIFTSGGTWTAPPGVAYVFATGCGGGGGGGGGAAVSVRYPDGTFANYFALGGGGGQPAPTFTQVVAVTPGVTYNISIGLGGAGGYGGLVYNRVGSGTTWGGVSPGYAGSNGGASIFGGVTFPGGIGGRRGEVFVGLGTGFSGGTNTNASPALPVTPPPATAAGFGADDLVRQGIFSTHLAPVTFPAAQGLSRLTIGGGGGGGGGYSNNINSIGGAGGQGAQGFNGYPFALPGANGAYGGGGGGGGGGEGYDYNNTHDGAVGGTGGNGFIEISWVA